MDCNNYLGHIQNLQRYCYHCDHEKVEKIAKDISCIKAMLAEMFYHYTEMRELNGNTKSDPRTSKAV